MTRRYPQRPEDWAKFPVELTDANLVVGDWQVMQRWEQPLMDVMAAEVTMGRGDVLEVGYGMGIAADAIIARGCRSYTVIEAHPVIAANARRWAERQPVAVTVLEGFWQSTIENLRQTYDGILFDTYPLSESERRRNHFEFIPRAPMLLRSGGRLTYYSDETIDFRPEHLRLLLTHFSEVKLINVENLAPPSDCEYWNENHMVIPSARRI